MMLVSPPPSPLSPGPAQSGRSVLRALLCAKERKEEGRRKRERERERERERRGEEKKHP